MELAMIPYIYIHSLLILKTLMDPRTGALSLLDSQDKVNDFAIIALTYCAGWKKSLIIRSFHKCFYCDYYECFKSVISRHKYGCSFDGLIGYKTSNYLPQVKKTFLLNHYSLRLQYINVLWSYYYSLTTMNSEILGTLENIACFKGQENLLDSLMPISW